ncbi:Hypothetical protein KVN_LOCUS306, partial [uncultured virus]
VAFYKLFIIYTSLSIYTKRCEPVSNFEFSNTSGNIIRNPHNFKIVQLDPEILKQRSTDREIADVEEQIEEAPEEVSNESSGSS